MKQKIVLITIFGIITFAILGAGAWLLSRPVGVEVEKSDQAKALMSPKPIMTGEKLKLTGKGRKDFYDQKHRRRLR